MVRRVAISQSGRYSRHMAPDLSQEKGSKWWRQYYHDVKLQENALGPAVRCAGRWRRSRCMGLFVVADAVPRSLTDHKRVGI